MKDINDPPMLVGPSSVSVEENKSGATLTDLVVDDPDVSDSHTITVDSERFEVVDNEVRIRDGVWLDFESEPQVNNTLKVVDGGMNVLVSELVVYVVNVNEKH